MAVREGLALNEHEGTAGCPKGSGVTLVQLTGLEKFEVAEGWQLNSVLLGLLGRMKMDFYDQ